MANTQRRDVRVSLSIKFALVSALLVVVVAGATTFGLIFRFRQARESEMVSRDRELAQMLAGLRTSSGVDFKTLTAFVDSADRVDTGLVYAIVLDGKQMLQGALNPRLFGKLSDAFQKAVTQGRRQVLEMLASGKLERQGLIKEYSLPVPKGQLRLGFDLRRIDQHIAEQSKIGLTILGVGLLLGILAAMVLARQLARPIKRLSTAMEAVASGDLQQTVQIHSSDEIASLAGSFNRMMRSLREGGRFEQTVLPYFARPVLQRILREENPIEMVAEERPVTVLVLRLTRPSRRIEPRQRLSLVNDFLAPCIDAIRAEDGVVLSTDTATVCAVWGVPEDAATPELSAIRAAIGARRNVQDEGRRQSMAGAATLALRAGICTGQVVAGNIGSVHRVSYGVVGDAMDVALRIAEEAEPDQLLAAEVTVSKIRDQINASAGPPLFFEDLDEAIPLYKIDS